MRWLAVSAVCFGVVLTGTTVTSTTPPRVQIEMRNVRLHVAGGVTMDIARLRGTMISRTESPPVFDDQRSYVLDVDTAALSMTPESLQALMNNHVFATQDAQGDRRPVLHR